MDINVARRLTKEIKRLEAELATLQRAAQDLVPVRDGQPKGQSQTSTVEKLVERLVSKEMEIYDLRSHLDAVKVELINRICAVDMADYEKRVLLLRYVSCMNFRDICFELDYSDARIYQWHRAGLEKLQSDYS